MAINKVIEWSKFSKEELSEGLRMLESAGRYDSEIYRRLRYELAKKTVEHQKVCAHCGRLFSAKRSDAKCCSSGCRSMLCYNKKGIANGWKKLGEYRKIRKQVEKQGKTIRELIRMAKEARLAECPNKC